MLFFKIFFSVFYGVFFCLLALMLFVFYMYGILPAVFVGLCALLVLCFLAFCSWQFDYRRRMEADASEMYHEILKLREEVNEKYSGLDDQIHKQEAEIKNLYHMIREMILFCQEEVKGMNHRTETPPVSGNAQHYSSPEGMFSASTLKQNGSMKEQVWPGTGQDVRRNMPVAVKNTGPGKTYSVKAELKGENSGMQPALYIYRDGAGAFRLTGQELIPARMQEGQILNRSQLDAMKAYDMFALFEVNSRQLQGHRIARIKPAVVTGLYDFEKNNSFEGSLFKKGKIEVEDPVT